MSKIVFLTKGLPASGKTTWAKGVLSEHPGAYKRVNKDLLREMLDDGRWSKVNEKFVLEERDAMIMHALNQGYHVIVDDTNLHPKHEQRIRELVKGHAAVEIIDFTHVDVEECIRRDQKRPNYVGEAVIRKMYNDFLRPAPPKVAYDSNLPDAILCDLDGTLCLFGDANPYERDFLADEVNAPVRSALEAHYAAGCRILLASGRKDTSREQTEEWLARNGIVYQRLWMRRGDDNRKDAIIKREIYEEHIRDRYNVLFVLDDRNQVVDLWRSLGLTCFQVAEGAF